MLVCWRCSILGVWGGEFVLCDEVHTFSSKPLESSYMSIQCDKIIQHEYNASREDFVRIKSFGDSYM